MTQDILQKHIKAIGLDALDNNSRNSLTELLGENFLLIVITRLSEKLSQDRALALRQYIEEQPDAEAVLVHIAKHYPEAEVIISEELQKIRQRLLHS